MATRQQMEEALVQADKFGNTEDAQTLANALKDLQGLDDSKNIVQMFGEEIAEISLEIAAGVNSGVTGILDIPPQLFNAVSSLAGSNKRAALISEMPFIKEATQGGYMEDGVAQKAIRLGGQVVGGAVLPVGGVLQASKNVPIASNLFPQGTKAVSQGVRQKAATNPNKFLKEEALTTGLFAAGATTASYLSSNDPVAEMIGGLFVSTKVAPVKALVDLGKASYETLRQVFSNKAQREKAIELIKRHADNPDKALATLNKNLLTTDKSKGTLAQMTGDEGIASLEKHLLKSSTSESFKQAINVSDENLNNLLFSKIDDLGGKTNGGVFRDHVKSKVRSAENSVNNIIEKAANNARQTAKTIGTPLEPADASRIFSIEKDIAFKQIRLLENEAWSAVPKNLMVETTALKKGFEQSLKELTPTARRDIASEIAKPKGLIQKLDKEVSPRELADLRSSITAQKRAAEEAKSSATTIEALNNMQKLIGNVIDSVDNSSSYRAATAITRKKHELFSEGVFAKATRKTTEEDIGEKLLRANGSGGALADDVLTIAKDYNINLQTASEDMIRASFIKSVTRPDGTISPRDANRFMSKYQNLLTRFPKVAQDLASAEKTQLLAEQTSKLGSKALRNIQKSKSKLYSTFDDPIRAVDAALRSKDQTKAFQYLVNLAKKDSSGNALKGLKRDVIDHLLEKITLTSKKAAELKPTYKRDFNKASRGYSTVLSSKELKELKNIAGEIDRFLIRNRVMASKSEEISAMLPRVLGQISGAKIGAKFGTSPLIAAGIGRRLAETQLSKIPKLKSLALVEDMILNPSNFSKYYNDVAKVKNVEQASDVLNAWILSAGVSNIAED